MSRRRLWACLDALLPASDCDTTPEPEPPPCARNARRLLQQARSAGAMVAHVLAARPPAGSPGWRALPGLGPEPSEPVFHRSGPSAFSDAGFTSLLKAMPGAELVLIGRSFHSSCLTTALEAVTLGVNVLAVPDALSLPPAERLGLEGLRQASRSHQRAWLRLESTSALLHRPQGLRIIEGGRA